MIMPLFKPTITKWHIFTPDFARRDRKQKYGCNDSFVSLQ